MKLGSVTAKVIAVGALLAALGGVVNGAIDIYNAVLKVPLTPLEKANDELFKKHFGKQPLVSQPVNIKASSVTVEMLLQVYDSGDVFIRYGDFQQWLPFRRIQVGARGFFPQAHAGGPAALPSCPGPSCAGNAIQIDVDSLKREQLQRAAAKETPTTIERSHVIAEMKDDHPTFFGASRKHYTRTFPAEAGYKIVKFDLHLGSANHHSIERVELVDGGRAVRVSFTLTSGPALDRYRGWIQGTLQTSQQKAP